MPIDVSKVQWDQPAPPKIDPNQVQWDQPAPTGIPGPRRASTQMGEFGRAAASLADVTVGGVIPAAVQMIGYPVLRAAGRTPEQASTAARGMAQQVESPFGKLFGVEQTPEYQAEASRRLMDFIGQNFQKGAAWIAEKTGLPQPDVESYMTSATLALPKVVSGTAQGVRTAAASPLAQDVRAGLQLPFEPALQARRERLSAEAYARGPQIDAAKEAQRLRIALNPSDVQPSAGARLTTALAGEKGQAAIVEANRNQVRQVVLRELGLPDTTQLNTPAAFNQARAQVAQPYNEVRKLPTMTADDALVERLNSLRADPNVIGAREYAPAIDRIVDQAIEQTRAGLNGEQLLKNVRVLRERARKTYNNKSATIEALDVADTNLAVANALESMIESNIFNPSLLQRFRDARQQMARSYAYEGATDLNTGLVDVKKIARITSKDNALTGDIASLGQIAGNFPEVFSTSVSTPWSQPARLARTGAATTLGGTAGYLIGDNYLGATLGMAAGAVAGEAASALAARRIASPEYQAGLRIRDPRIPVNELAPVPPPANALAPYVAPQSVLMPGEGAFVTGAPAPGLRQTAEGVYVAPAPAPGPQRVPRAQFVGPAPTPPGLPAPSAEATMATLRAEDVRRAGVSRAIGKEAEARQAAAEAAARRPAGGEVMLELDPVTGRLREASQGVKGATPETFQNYGANLASAVDKVTAGKRFDLTAAEKVAWERTKVDLAEVAPGFKSLSDKAIAEKMLDRQWVESAVVKAREKAAAYEQIAARAKDAQSRRDAIANRERMLDTLDTLEERLRAPRPVELGGQGPKTRAAKRNALTPQSTNALAP